jgi:hypothetical protein
MAIKDDIAKFLRTSPQITRINFSLGRFKVYPSAYQKDVADAVDSGEIKVQTFGASSGAGASYREAWDVLALSPTFSIASPRDQAFLVHECTHAHFDIQNMGSNPVHENEAASYLAEAIFVDASGIPPLGTEKIRTVSHSLSSKVLAGTYWIASADAAALTLEVAKHPHYATMVSYNSNGFNRNAAYQILR